MIEEFEVTVTRITRAPEYMNAAAADVVQPPLRQEVYKILIPSAPSIEALATLCAAVKPKRVRKPKGGN